MNIFLPQSGNLGDTSNILPVLSGLYKSTGEQVNLLVRDKMKSFKGFKHLMEAQECIASLRFESKPLANESYQSAYLSNDIPRSLNRPWETERYEVYFKEHFLNSLKVDDDFELNVPERDVPIYDYVVGDRTYSKDADTRRAFDVLITMR